MPKITFNDELELISFIRQIVQEELSISKTGVDHPSKEDLQSISAENLSNKTESTSWFVIGKPQPDPTRQVNRKRRRPHSIPVVSEPYRPDLTHLETLPYSPSIPLFL